MDALSPTPDDDAVPADPNQPAAAPATAEAPRATLARLRIAGFKSFAEPTTVEVLPGLTGIVGPNGCGKSNIVEALRWAMGETSARSMRGGEMEDVIFAGTASRPGRNLAEVSLFLEDAAGLAPPPNAEVAELEIIRKIARGEGSNFRVNGREVRARDVQTLFADLGSGARASAMVSQGRVATLISAKPEERRQVLEEAAGIGGLRARRHEAELKLRQAEGNLLRAEDLLGQLDAQRQGLQRQARQANRYRNLSGLVRQAEGEWLAILAARAAAALETARASFDAAAQAVARAEAGAVDAAETAAEAERALPGPRAAEAAARTALERRRVETEGLEAAERRAQVALAAAEEQLATILADLGHAEGMALDAAAAEERLSTEATALATAAEALPARLSAAEAALHDAAEAARLSERAANAATEDAASIAARIEQAAAARAVAAQRLRRLGEQHDRLAVAHAEALAGRIPPERLTADEAASAAAASAFAAAREALANAEATRTTAQDAEAATRRAVETAEAEAGRARTALAEASQRLERIAAEQAEVARAHATALAAQILPGELAGAEAEAARAEAELEQRRTALSAAEAARAEAQESHAGARRRIADAEAARERAAAEHAAAAQRAAQAGAQLARLTEARDAARAAEIPAATLGAAQAAESAAEQQLAGALARVGLAEQQRATAAAALEGARRQAAETAAAAAGAAAEVAALRETLAGETAGPQASPVLEAITVPAGLEAALGAALGESLDSPLDSPLDPGAARYWRALPPLAVPPPLPAGLTPLGDLVPVPPALARAMSQIGLVDAEAAGAALQPLLAPGQAAVSRSGAMWRWDGHTSRAEAPNPSAARLQQRARLRLAEARLGSLQSVATAAAEAAQRAEQTAAARATEEANAREARRQGETLLSEARAQANRLRAAAAEATSRLSALAPQLAQLAADREGAEAAAATAAAALAALPGPDAAIAEYDTAAAAEAAAAAAETEARDARAEAEMGWPRSRAAAAALAARAAEAASRLGGLAPQLERLTEEKQGAEATLAEARAAVAVLPELALLRTNAAGAARRAEQAIGAETEARAGRAVAEHALAEAREAAGRLAVAAGEAESRIAALTPQLDAVQAELADAEAADMTARAAAAALPDLGAVRAGVAAARDALGTARMAETAAREALSALRGEGGRIAARQAALFPEQSAWATRRGDATARQAALAARRDEAAVARDGLQAAPAEAAARRAAAGAELAAAEAVHAAALTALNAAERAVRQGVEARRRADADFAGQREAQVKAESQVEQAMAAAAAVAARIEERLGAEVELPAMVETTEAAEEKARRKLDRLTREREEMGPVNLRAEVELAELEARIGGISGEREEIGAAIAKLRGSIGHLNREGRERLRAVFDRVDQEFRALFGRLFGGGRAHLGLVGSDDPLEAGLEIYAEPPGKKLSTLSLLSGGEQALTALSLIFAVFRCHPAPVCVLDEVDAPLDDANVERLCDLLDGMAAESGTRFLVVTHHQLTMARMHRLYGVTMQERGVSRLLSVDLGRAIELAEQRLA